MNPYIFVGLKSTASKTIPLGDLKKIETILKVSGKVFNIKGEKNQQTTAPQRYIGLLVAKKLLNYPNYNTIAKTIENMYGLPKRSSIVHTLMSYNNMLEHNKQFKEKYDEILASSEQKLKLNINNKNN